MAQTPQAEATVTSTGQTTPPAEGQPDFGIGSPTTILLLLFAVAIFWWSMRRRRALEERMTAQRRAENVAAAEQSAREIAHIMRQAPPPGAAAAAASEGLASAARLPEASIWPPLRESPAPQAEVPPLEDAQIRTSERAEAAMEEGLLAAQRAEQTAGESVARRLAAAESVAAEVQADTADALGTRFANEDGVARGATARARADTDGATRCRLARLRAMVRPSVHRGSRSRETSLRRSTIFQARSCIHKRCQNTVSPPLRRLRRPVIGCHVLARSGFLECSRAREAPRWAGSRCQS